MSIARRVVAVTPTAAAPKVRVARKPRVVKPKPEKIEKPPPTLKQLQQQAARTQYEDHLWRDLSALHLPLPERQALWHPTSNYKADFLWPRERLLVEVDGGVYLRYGHHSSGKGYEYDRVRDAEALCLGYTVLRVTPSMVKDGTAVAYVERVLHALWARNGRKAV